MIKIAWLLDRLRRRRSRSSPPVRQIALAAASAGLAILVIRAFARRAKSTDAGAPAAAQDDAQEAASIEPPTGNDTVASESTLTDRVQSEMFRQSGAPASTTESG
jgi:hypothetical protein